MSQLIPDINLPTLEDTEVIPRSPRTEAALQTASLDWNAEVEQEASLSPAGEEVMDVEHFHDPYLPSPTVERIPLDQGCSGQRFKQESF